jgi:hypothetical protein
MRTTRHPIDVAETRQSLDALGRVTPGAELRRPPA